MIFRFQSKREPAPLQECWQIRECLESLLFENLLGEKFYFLLANLYPEILLMQTLNLVYFFCVLKRWKISFSSNFVHLFKKCLFIYRCWQLPTCLGKLVLDFLKEKKRSSSEFVPSPQPKCAGPSALKISMKIPFNEDLSERFFWVSNRRSSENFVGWLPHC